MFLPYQYLETASHTTHLAAVASGPSPCRSTAESLPVLRRLSLSPGESFRFLMPPSILLLKLLKDGMTGDLLIGRYSIVVAIGIYINLALCRTLERASGGVRQSNVGYSAKAAFWTPLSWVVLASWFNETSGRSITRTTVPNRGKQTAKEGDGNQRSEVKSRNVNNATQPRECVKSCLGSAWSLRVSGQVMINKGPRATHAGRCSRQLVELCSACLGGLPL